VLTVLEYVFVLIVVGGLLFLLVSFVFGRGEALTPVPPDSVPVELPEQRPATGVDIERLRLPVVLRGYRMHEVDWVLDRLAGELDSRDEELSRRDGEIERLRAQLAGLRPAEPADDREPAEPAGRDVGGGEAAGREAAGAREPVDEEPLDEDLADEDPVDEELAGEEAARDGVGERAESGRAAE
jgi:DivIVA domain-containing protein